MNLPFRQLAVATVVAGMCHSGAAFAQEDSFIEEVIVTATKRASSLQETPVAVSVTTADVIEKAQINDLQDLQSVVPTLRVSQLQNSTNTNFVIRGFGNGANNPGIEPSVGVFIDGVYRSRSAGAITDLPNLQRVEVLSGPQSTLFGKNASAGVISVVSGKPSGEVAGNFSLSFGNFNQVIAKGYYEAPVSDTVAFSVAGSYNTRDGYAENLFTGNDANNRDRQSIRGQLLISPSDATEIRIIADFDTLDEECCYAANLISGPASNAIRFAGGNLVDNDPEARTFFANVDSTNQQDNAGISIQVDHDFGSVSLTSITALRDLDTFALIDTDFTSADTTVNPVGSQIETFTQEIRLSSDTGGSYDWLVGGYFFDESVENQAALNFNAGFRPFADALTGAPGTLAGVEGLLGIPQGSFFAAGTATEEQSTLDNQALSIFGQLDFDISDSLSATVGFNYTRDEKDVSVRQVQSDLFSSLDFVNIGFQGAFAGAFQQITGLAPTPQNIAAVPQAAQAAQAFATQASTDPSQNPLLGLQALQFLPPLVDFPNEIESGQSDDDDLTYTLRLAWDINDNFNAYGSFSTGFKATSWNLSRDTSPFPEDIAALSAAGLTVPNLVPGTRFAGPEEAEVFEIGLKGRYENFAFNVAIFDQTIEGFQSNAFTGTGFNLTNAGSQSTRGVEFDFTYYPVESLEIKVGGALLDAVYDEFTGALDEVTGQIVDLTGQDVGGVTDLNLSLAVNYNFTVGQNEGFFRSDFYFEDDTPIGDLATSQFIRSTENLNVSLGVTTPSQWTFSVWGRNITDHVSLISAFPSVAQLGSFSGYPTQPRTYGVTISKKF